jgi:hypothetical protein
MVIVRRAVLVAVLAGVALLLVSCGSSNPKTVSAENAKAQPATEVKPPALYTAKACFSRMVDSAQRWQFDAVPVQLESELNEESMGHEGKATVWHARFASPSQRKLRTFTCSGSRLAGAAPFGVTGSVESPYPPHAIVAVFQPAYLQIDSDKAFSIAQSHGGSTLMKDDPKQPVYYFAALDPKTSGVHWFVSYGKSLDDTDGIGVIDASTGKYLRATGPSH